MNFVIRYQPGVYARNLRGDFTANLNEAKTFRSVANAKASNAHRHGMPVVVPVWLSLVEQGLVSGT